MQRRRTVLASSTAVSALLLAFLLAAPGAGAEQEVDLSPTRWPDREALEAPDAFFETEKPIAVGEHGVVTATTGPAAVRAGLEALRQGGTAADAVITTALTQVVLAGGSWVSYAGIFNLVYYEAANGKVWNLNAGYDTVRGELNPLTIPRNSSAGGSGEASGRTVLVPGFFGGVAAAHARFGRMPWAALFAPALHYSEQGFRLGTLHDSMLRRRERTLRRLPQTRAIFTREDGSLLAAGDLLRQPELAATLRAVADGGTDYIYRGAWAEELVAAVARDGGSLSLADLAAYEPIWQQPMQTTYGGYDVYGHGLPAQGGAHLVEVLNLAEAADLRSMGHYASSPTALFWLSQMTNLVAVAYLPEPMRRTLFGELDATLAARVGKLNAQGLWARMAAGEFPLTTVPVPVDPEHSDAIVAIDAWGNVAAAVHSINTAAWGETGIFVGGISIPDSASFQQALVAEAGPGARLPDPTEPVIVLAEGRPVFALASIGAGLHQKTVSVLLNLLDWHMSLEAAIAAPSTHLPTFASGKSAQQVMAGDFDPGLIAAARELGLEIDVLPTGPASNGPRGYVVGAALSADGQRRAVATTLLNGLAMAH